MSYSRKGYSEAVIRQDTETFEYRANLRNNSQSQEGKLSRMFFLVIPCYAELAFQFATTKLGDSDRAAFSNMFDPATLKYMVGQRRSKRAGEMIASFAPIEALPGENATGFS